MRYKFDLEFQKLVMKHIIEMRKIRYVDILKPSLFDDDVLRIIFRFIKNTFKQTFRIPSYDIIARNAGGLYNLDIDENISDLKEKVLEVLHEIKEMDDVSEETIKEQIYDFVRMQSIRELWVGMGENIDQGEYNINDYLGTLHKINSFKDEFDMINYFEEYYKQEYFKDRKKILTHITKLNEWLEGGLEFGEIGVVTGEPGLGKTYFLINLGSVACMAGFDVVYFTLEISKENLKRRLDSCISMMEWGEIRDDPDGFGKIVEKKYKKGDFIIVHYPGQTASVSTIKDDILYIKENVKGKDGELIKPKLLIVDYLDELKYQITGLDDWKALGLATGMLKKLGEEENMAVWTAQQINREGYGKSPKMQHTQSSIKIPQVCDVFIGLASDPRHEDIMKITVDKLRNAKSRKGSRIYVRLEYNISRMREINPQELKEDEEE